MYEPSLFLKTLCFITSVRLKPSTIQTILPFNRTTRLHCERSMTKKVNIYSLWDLQYDPLGGEVVTSLLKFGIQVEWL